MTDPKMTNNTDQDVDRRCVTDAPMLDAMHNAVDALMESTARKVLNGEVVTNPDERNAE